MKKLADLIRQERQKSPVPGPAAIRAALVEQGHSVSISYIKLVLWRDRMPKKKAKKKPKWQKHWPTTDSVSQAIRALLYEDPKMPTAIIQSRLKEQKKEASANLIKVVRHEWKKRTRPHDYYGSDGSVRPRREQLKLRFMRDLQNGMEPMPIAGTSQAEIEAIIDEARRELGLEPRLPVGGTRSKTEIDAVWEELMRKLEE